MIGVIIRLLTGISHQKHKFPISLYWFLDRYSPLWLIEIMPYNNQNYSKDQIQQNIAIPMRFTKKARLFKSSAPQLFTMISKF